MIEAKKDNLVEGVTRTVFKIKVQIGLTLQLATNNFTDLVEQIQDQKICVNFTLRSLLLDRDPPKYQRTFCKIAPQPLLTLVPAPYSKSKSSFIFPKQLKSIFENKNKYLPFKSTMNGLLIELSLLRTSTAFLFWLFSVVPVVAVAVVLVVVVASGIGS